METSGLEPEITICKIVVLPVKLCPLKPGYLGQAPWTPSKASFSSLPCMPPLPGQGVFSFVLDAPLLPSFPPPTRSEDSPPYTPQIPFRSPPPSPFALYPLHPTIPIPFRHPFPHWNGSGSGTMERMGIREWIGIWIVWRIGTRVPSWRPTDLPRQLAGLLRSVRSLGDLASYAVSSLHGFAPGQARERVGHLPIRAFERPSLDVRRRLVPPFASLPQALGLIARTLPVPWPYLLGSVLALAYA